MSKFADLPRNKFADPEPEKPQSIEDFKPYTLAWAIQFYIDDMDEIGKPVGSSQAYNMRAMQSRPLGKKMVKDLQDDDFLDYAKERKKRVLPVTIGHDLSNIRVVLAHCKSARKDCKNFGPALTAIDEDAMSLLAKYNLVGKGTPRKRRTKDEEYEALLTHFRTPSGHGHARVIPMAEIMAFARVSARRLGEICRITWGDIDWERKVYIVRDLKHPTKKKGNDKEFALFPEIAEIIRRQPRLRPDDPTERVFPHNSKSCSQAYTNAKSVLGIENLHFHDLRADAISYWLLKLGSKDLVRKLVSGHETDKQIDSTYDRRSTAEIIELVPSHVWQVAAPIEQRVAA